jgi:hypothetical protein
MFIVAQLLCREPAQTRPLATGCNWPGVPIPGCIWRLSLGPSTWHVGPPSRPCLVRRPRIRAYCRVQLGQRRCRRCRPSRPGNGPRTRLDPACPWQAPPSSIAAHLPTSASTVGRSSRKDRDGRGSATSRGRPTGRCSAAQPTRAQPPAHTPASRRSAPVTGSVPVNSRPSLALKTNSLP